MSLYATGTITGALNATTISGTGTKWSDAKLGITNGSVLFISSNAGVDGVYQVKRVISDTSIELAQPIYKTFTNSKYSILVAESASTAAWSNQLAATLGYYQAQMDGWQQIMTGTGDVALTAPDGTKVTIKSFTKMSQDIDKKQDKSDILTDLSKSKDADGVREYLGLKETINKAASALQNGSWGLGNVNYGVFPMGVTSQFLIYSSSAPEVPANCAGFQAAYGKTRRAQMVINTMGEVFSRFSMSDEVLDKTTPWAKHFTTLKPPTANEVNAWPIEIRGMIGNGTLLSSANQTGVYLVSIADPTTVVDFPKNNNVPLYGYGFVIVTKNGATLNQLYMSHRGHMANRQSWNNEAGYNAWDIVYGTVNTTVDSNGFIKRASPIVKLFSDGSSELNSESEGVIVSRESVGVYRISGVLGMNSDGAWGGIDGGFEVPTDRNGQRLLWLDYEVEADGSIIVKTYHRTYPDAPVFARNIKDGYEEGDLIDIPSDQFLSVRVEMPQDSIWNLAQKAAQEEMKQEQIAEE